MEKKERILALLAGERVTPPLASFFQHRHADEQDPRSLTRRLVEFNTASGWDFIKVQSRATYYNEAWGCKVSFDPVGGPEMTDHIIKSYDDFMRLHDAPVDTGPFAEHIEAATLLREATGGATPCVHTLFSPITVLSRLRGAVRRTASETDQLRADIAERPDAVRHGLEVVTRSLEAYVSGLMRAGADGIFITTTGWDADHLSDADYRSWAAPYERRLYEAAIAGGSWLNIVHACRPHTHFDIAAGYPVQILSYDACSGRNPTLAEGLRRTDKVLWSGVSVAAFQADDKDRLAREVEEAWSSTKGRQVVIGPTCAVPPATSAETFSFVRDVIGGLR